MADTLPLHPFAAHFPIALALFVPLLGFMVAFGVLKWGWPDKTWALVIVFQLAFLISAIATARLGHQEEERVENHISHDALEEHEEMGEKLPWAAGIAFGLSLVPLIYRKKWKAGVFVSLAASAAVVIPVLLTGKSGGKLVYQEGAADAYVQPKAGKPDVD